MTAERLAAFELENRLALVERQRDEIWGALSTAMMWWMADCHAPGGDIEKDEYEKVLRVFRKHKSKRKTT